MSDAGVTNEGAATEPEAAAPDPVAERLTEMTKLLEEIVDDNTAVMAAITRLGQAQDGVGTDIAREIVTLRGDLTGALTYRTLKDLCTELVGPLAALDAMLDHGDFTQPDAVEKHLRSLSVTLRGVLVRMGAERVAIAVGEEPFDPNRHHCARVLDPGESPFPDAPPRTVVRVVEDGYLLDGRLLTPPHVEIQAQRPPADDNDGPAADEPPADK